MGGSENENEHAISLVFGTAFIFFYFLTAVEGAYRDGCHEQVPRTALNPASAAPGIIRVASPQAHWLRPEYSGFPSTRHYH